MVDVQAPITRANPTTSGAKLDAVFSPKNLWEPGLPAMASGNSEYMPSDTPFSRAGSLLQCRGVAGCCVHTPKPVGVSLLAMALAHSKYLPADTPLSLASQLPQCPGRSWMLCFHQKYLWEPGLPAMASGHSEYMPSDTPFSRVGSLPQCPGRSWMLCFHQKTCRSEPARDGVGTFRILPADTPLSLASQLPQCPG
jgi:hypothetical protein